MAITAMNNVEVKCKIAIEELEHRESSFLYKTLAPLCQTAYSEQQRFVFVNFAPVKAATLEHMVAVLNNIDIPTYFVSVTTNQASTARYFRSLPDPISVIESSGNTKPLFNSDNKMCAHAWVGLHVDPNGTTRLCCEYLDQIKDNQGRPYNIKNSNILDILDSNYIKQVRQQFRQGITPSACSTCSRRESAGGASKRTLTPYKLKNIYGSINWESDDTDSIGFISGHLGNLCNLKCRICNENFSSSIAAEKIKFSIYQDKKQDPVYQSFANSWANYSEKFYAKLKQLVPQIKNFEFLGGEPLMVKENLDFMQYLIDTGHSKDCIFEFVTNGTQYPDIFNQAHLFKRLTITLSIDNLGERFELERSGADWAIVERNVEQFVSCKNSSSSMEIGTSITVNIQNVYYLPELIEWLTAKGVSHYFYNWLDQPQWLSLDALTPAARDMVLTKLTSSNLPAPDQEKLGMVIERVRQSATSNGDEFCQKMMHLDSIRSQKFSLTHKEIAQAMGYML